MKKFGEQYEKVRPTMKSEKRGSVCECFILLSKIFLTSLLRTNVILFHFKFL